MISRFMRVMVFFDLPTITDKNRHDYRKFRQFLVQEGFIMMQESVYVKLALNQNTAAAIIDALKKNKPPEGLVQILSVTEKQFSKIEIITGDYSSDTVDSDERLLML